jgi:hypothetical protein
MTSFFKWLATAILIAGSAVNGLGYYPEGPLMLVAGGVIWMLIALKVRDWALVTTNAVMGLVGVVTVVYTLTSLEPDYEMEEMQPQTCPERELRLLLPRSKQPELALWLHLVQGTGGSAA